MSQWIRLLIIPHLVAGLFELYGSFLHMEQGSLLTYGHTMYGRMDVGVYIGTYARKQICIHACLCVYTRVCTVVTYIVAVLVYTFMYVYIHNRAPTALMITSRLSGVGGLVACL